MHPTLQYDFTVDFVGAVQRPTVSCGDVVFRFGRDVTVEKHDEHDDEYHCDGHHRHGEYPYELRHQLIVLQRRHLQWGPCRLRGVRFGLVRSVSSRARHRLPGLRGIASGSRPVRLHVRCRGFPRRRLKTNRSAWHPESRRARAVHRRRFVGFAYRTIIVAENSRLPDRQSTGAAAAENRRPGGGRLAAPGPVVAVWARFVAGVQTAEAPASDVAL